MLARLVTAIVLIVGIAPATLADQLVFGSFRSTQNASNWAQKLSKMFAQEMVVHAFEQNGETMYRVTTVSLGASEFAALGRRADAAGVRYWRLHKDVDNTRPASDPGRNRNALAEVAPRLQPPGPEPLITAENIRSLWDLGVQTRSFAEHGVYGQDQFEASVSIKLEYFRGWDNDAQSVTFTPFLRIDSADDERTHGDIRELFYSRISDSWDLHVGAKRIFWGVTEFNHLVDIVNQTDLVENIDTEDKLGQPMVQLSMVRDWGIVDMFALVGFRERTFPGEDGRVRLPFEILDNATYESGAEQQRVDMAIRWSNYMGPIELGLHHFSGTSRDPMLIPEIASNGDLVLRPHYPVIDQTGIDAQAFYGDWAFKLEGYSRSGFGDRYAAATVGFERTLVGVFGTPADFGLVMEYMFDERDDDATNTLLEHDIALGGRLQFNDFADTRALLGIILDTDNDDYIVSLEASRRLSDSWLLSLEGRLFAGGEKVRRNTSGATLLQTQYKSAWLQEDDYLQLELKKFL